MKTNYKIVKKEGKQVTVINTKSERTHEGTLFANGTKVALHTWGGRTLINKPKIVTVA